MGGKYKRCVQCKRRRGIPELEGFCEPCAEAQRNNPTFGPIKDKRKKKPDAKKRRSRKLPAAMIAMMFDPEKLIGKVIAINAQTGEMSIVEDEFQDDNLAFRKAAMAKYGFDDDEWNRIVQFCEHVDAFLDYYHQLAVTEFGLKKGTQMHNAMLALLLKVNVNNAKRFGIEV